MLKLSGEKTLGGNLGNMMERKIKLNLRVEVSFDEKTRKRLTNGDFFIKGRAKIILQEEEWETKLNCVWSKSKEEVLWGFNEHIPKTIQQKIQKVYTRERVLEMFEEN